MVYFFTANPGVGSGNGARNFRSGDGADCGSYTIYMGKDKHENEHLIKHSSPDDLWFHVDKYSSAHLYLELDGVQRSTEFGKLELGDVLPCIGQLTKANSIKANKLNNITVIYTPVSNLHNDGSMDVGTVGFKNPKRVRRVVVTQKDNAVVNKITKTKREISTEAFIERQREKQRQSALEKQKMHNKTEQEARAKAKEYENQQKTNQDPYADLFTQENVNVNSNEFRNENWVEDEFW